MSTTSQTWNVVHLNLSEILANPQNFVHIRNVVIRYTDHPIEDLNRGWSRASCEPTKSLWEIMLWEADLRCINDWLGGVTNWIDLESILYRIEKRLAASDSERVIAKLAELELLYEPLENLHNYLTEEEITALANELLERYEKHTGYTFAYDESLGGWYRAEQGLSAFRGEHLPQALLHASRYRNFSLRDFKTMLAFHPAWTGWNSDSEVFSPFIVSAIPKSGESVYIINVDTHDWGWNLDNWPEEEEVE